MTLDKGRRLTKHTEPTLIAYYFSLEFRFDNIIIQANLRFSQEVVKRDIANVSQLILHGLWKKSFWEALKMTPDYFEGKKCHTAQHNNITIILLSSLQNDAGGVFFTLFTPPQKVLCKITNTLSDKVFFCKNILLKEGILDTLASALSFFDTTQDSTLLLVNVSYSTKERYYCWAFVPTGREETVLREYLIPYEYTSRSSGNKYQISAKGIILCDYITNQSFYDEVGPNMATFFHKLQQSSSVLKKNIFEVRVSFWIGNKDTNEIGDTTIFLNRLDTCWQRHFLKELKENCEKMFFFPIEQTFFSYEILLCGKALASTPRHTLARVQQFFPVIKKAFEKQTPFCYCHTVQANGTLLLRERVSFGEKNTTSLGQSYRITPLEQYGPTLLQ